MVKWFVPNSWRGELCFILGGGPSLRPEDVARLPPRGRIIAVNNAYLLAPNADVLYFADRRWFRWHTHYHLKELQEFKGIIATRATEIVAKDVELHMVERNANVRLAEFTWEVAGLDSGANAINIAYHFGADPIVLLGFDMKPNGHWFGDHEDEQGRKWIPREGIYEEKFAPGIEAMVREIRKHNREVFTTTEDSGLTTVPYRPLKDFL